MLITCPNCKSVFKLPDPHNLDKKLRCSICKTVFAVRDADYEMEEEEQNLLGGNAKTTQINLDTPFATDTPVTKKSK